MPQGRKMKGRAADRRGRKGRKTEIMAEAFRQIRQLTKYGAKTWKFQTENTILHYFLCLVDDFLQTALDPVVR